MPPILKSPYTRPPRRRLERTARYSGASQNRHAKVPGNGLKKIETELGEGKDASYWRVSVFTIEFTVISRSLYGRVPRQNRGRWRRPGTAELPTEKTRK